MRLVDLTNIYAQLGPYLCISCLPGFHAITGFDYNPAVFKKGKFRPFKLLKNNEEYQQALLKLGGAQLFDDEK